MHFLADFVFQPKYIIEDKMKDNAFGYLTLVGHCFAHAVLFGLALWFMGDSCWYELSVLIFVTHFIIDTLKIRHIINVWVDQLLHYIVICSVLI